MDQKFQPFRHYVWEMQLMPVCTFSQTQKKKSKCNPLRKEWKLLGLGYATLAKTKINIYCIKRTILDSLFFSYGRWYKMQVPPACTILFFFFFVPATQGLCTLFFYPSIYIVSKNENENKVVGIIIIRFMIFFLLWIWLGQWPRC